MNREIIRIACTLAEVENETKLLEANYIASLKKHDEVKKRLSLALCENESPETLAITLDDQEVLVCIWEGEGNYDFSLIRSFS